MLTCSLIIFSPFPTEIAILRHHAETNDIFLLGGRRGPSPFTKMNKVEIFMLETLILYIGYRLPPNLFISTMYRYWEQTVTNNYFEIKFSLYVADVSFSNFVDSFRNAWVAQVVVAKISFQEDFFYL